MDMARAIDEVVADLRPAVAARLQQLRIQRPPGELIVNGDKLRLGQVMSNLISNASKYTQHGGSIEVSVTASEGTLAISVTDNGIGISAKALPHIFEPFMQEHRAASFDASGLGIGLSLVRELVQAHGGQVAAASAGVGQGSCFTVTLPLLRVG
jgi:signal transduction histidine kinase